FADGLDTLIDPKELTKVDGRMKATIPFATSTVTMMDLIKRIRDEYIKTDRELFYTDKGLRPGILVLVNDADWELTDDGVDKYEQELGNKDEVVFISTLHGG
ncbi:Ubiquitin- modifier 1, partial [Coemansia sp. Cherry 401B]